MLYIDPQMNNKIERFEKGLTELGLPFTKQVEGHHTTFMVKAKAEWNRNSGVVVFSTFPPAPGRKRTGTSFRAYLCKASGGNQLIKAHEALMTLRIYLA